MQNKIFGCPIAIHNKQTNKTKTQGKSNLNITNVLWIKIPESKQFPHKFICLFLSKQFRSPNRLVNLPAAAALGQQQSKGAEVLAGATLVPVSPAETSIKEPECCSWCWAHRTGTRGWNVSCRKISRGLVSDSRGVNILLCVLWL